MTKTKRFSIGRLLLILAVLFIVIAGGWAWWVYKHPLATYVKSARRGLESMGLERIETEIAGKRLVYFAGGEGPRLVLLHGAGDQAGTWATIAGTLMEEYELLLVDLPGHGDSEPGEGPLPFDEVVDGLDAFLEIQTREGPVILVGNSMGAWLASLQAHQHPERVARAGSRQRWADHGRSDQSTPDALGSRGGARAHGHASRSVESQDPRFRARRHRAALQLGAHRPPAAGAGELRSVPAGRSSGRDRAARGAGLG